MSDEMRDTPEPGAPREDWREVVEALNALGESIGRATRAAVDDDENRRRLRELRDGLEALALRLGESVEQVAASPEGRMVKQAVGEAATTVEAAGERVVEEVRPEMANAFRQATAKFKQAADAYDKPASAPASPVTPAPGVPAAAPTAAWGAPAPSVTPAPTIAVSTPIEPAVSAESVAVPASGADAGQLAPSLLEAVRATNDRFQAERKAAVEAAAPAAAIEPELVVEPAPELELGAKSELAAEPGQDPAPEPAPEPADDAPMQDDPAGSSADEDLYSLIPGVAAETPAVSFDSWGKPQSDPVTGQPNGPVPEQPGLFECTDESEGEDETRASRVGDFDFREVDEGPTGTGGGYTP